MTRHKMMCPNEACDRYGQETSLMGGCDCGTPLVRYKTRDELISESITEIFVESLWRLSPTLAARYERNRARATRGDFR